MKYLPLLLALALAACGGDSAETLDNLPATGSSAPSEQSARPAEESNEEDGPSAGAEAAIDPATGYMDPVCRMKIAEDAAFRHTHDGVTYGFCSASCQANFSEDPDAYLVALEE